MDLSEIRKQLDECDAEIVKLFEKLFDKRVYESCCDFKKFPITA